MPNRNRLLIMNNKSNNTHTSSRGIRDESTVFHFRVDCALLHAQYRVSVYISPISIYNSHLYKREKKEKKGQGEDTNN